MKRRKQLGDEVLLLDGALVMVKDNETFTQIKVLTPGGKTSHWRDRTPEHASLHDKQQHKLRNRGFLQGARRIEDRGRMSTEEKDISLKKRRALDRESYSVSREAAACCDRALVLLRSGDLSRAEAEYRMALTHNPRCSDAYFGLGFCVSEKKVILAGPWQIHGSIGW